MGESATRGRLGDLALFVVAAAIAVLPFVDATPWWGLQHAKFLGFPWKLIPSIGLALMAIVYAMPGLSGQLVTWIDQRVLLAPWWVHLLLCLGVAGLGLLFPMQTHFLGDGYTVLGFLSNEKPFIWSFTAPGIVLFLRGVQSLCGSPSAESAIFTLRIASALSAVFAVWAALQFVKSASRIPSLRVLIFSAICFSPLAIFWFGYSEHYPPILSLLLWWGVFALRCRVLSWPVISMSLLIALCYPPMSPLLLAPLAAWGIEKSGLSQVRDFLKSISLTYIMTIALVLSLLLISFANALHLEARGVSLVNPILGGRDALLSLDYWLQRGNLLVLLLPSLIALLCWSGKRETDPPLVLTLATLMGVVGYLAIQSIFGVAFDWDLLALFLAIPLLWLCATLINAKVTASRALAVTFLSLTSAASFVLAAVDTPTAIARHHSLLRLNVGKTSMGWRVLENFYDARGDTTRAGEIAREAVDYFPGDALRAQARLSIDSSKWDEAYRFAQQVMLVEPDAQAYLLRGLALSGQGLFNQAAVDLDSALALNSAYPEALFNRAGLYLATGQYDTALVLLRRASSDSTFRYRALEALAYSWYQLDILDSFIATARLLRMRHPNSPMVNIAFTEYSLRTGDTTAALEYLRVFEMYGRDYTEYDDVLKQFYRRIGLTHVDSGK